MGGGVRVESEGAGDDVSALDAPLGNRRIVMDPITVAPRQQAQSISYAPGDIWRDLTTRGWADAPRWNPPLPDVQMPLPGTPGDLGSISYEPLQPMVPPVGSDAFRQNLASAEGQMRMDPQRVAAIRQQLRSTPNPSAQPSGPSFQGNVNSSNRPGLNPKTSLPLYFAKAMGYAVPGQSGDEEEARFAKAAHQALLKMTKGMTVARFLQSHQSPKTRDAFGKLLDAELRKGQPSMVNTPPNDSPATASTSRLPLQPSEGG